MRSPAVVLSLVVLAPFGHLAACGGATSGDAGDAGTGGDTTAVLGSSTAATASATATNGLSCTSAFVQPGPSSSGSVEIPVYHRDAAACCPATRGPAPGTQPYTGDLANGCSADADCTAGHDGRCYPWEGLVGNGGCSYDECFTDSDCPSGGACLCRTSAADDGPNICVAAGNCLTDADCGAGGYCSPSQTSCYGAPTYFCHTAKDTCINDSDCAPADAGAESCDVVAACTYQSGSWGCTQSTCCPP